MENIIEFIEEHSHFTKVIACCCGHGKDNVSIVIKTDGGEISDLMSGVIIPREKRFYKKDEQGYYYLPEIIPDN